MANIALTSAGSTITESSSFGAGFPAASVIDGVRTSGGNWESGGGWASNGNPSGVSPEYLDIDFGQSRTIDTVNVFTLKDSVNDTTAPTLSDTFTLYGILDFEIQQWNGSAFASITGASVTGNNKVWKQFTFTALTTTKIRLKITAAMAGRARVTEVEAMEAAGGGDLTPTITTASVPAGTVGAAYDQTLAVSSGDVPITWSKQSGTLPPGISFNTSTHKFEGTPTTAGTYGSIVIRATDTDGDFDEETYSIVINPADTSPVITTGASLPIATAGVPYTAQLAATGGEAPLVWDIPTPVTGVSISSTGLVSIPGPDGASYVFTARVRDENGAGESDTQEFTVEVSDMAYISLCHKRPLKRVPILTTTEFQPIEGDEEVAEDVPVKYEYTIQVAYFTHTEGDDLRTFFYNHRLKQPFLWHNPDRDETKTVKLVSSFPEDEVLAYGGFEVVLRDV